VKRGRCALAVLFAASAAAACDGLIGLTDPTVDAGANDAATSLDADASGDDAPEHASDSAAEAREAGMAFMMEAGAPPDVSSVTSDATAETGPGGNGQDAQTCLTCLELGYNCGATGDGCGTVIQCGTCTPPEFCGGGGFSVCGGGGVSGDSGTMSCAPKTCPELGYTCGAASDGCGNMLRCGTCTPPESCGGGGSLGQCGGGDP
jgi:hypothetical protein